MVPPTVPSPFRKALVLANPIAGSGRARGAAKELAAGLERIGIEVELHFTRERGEARERAQELDRDVDLVVSAGGDGTLGEVLSGLSKLPGRDVPVAILAAGTANVMSLDLGLPRRVADLLEVIALGRTAPVDTARVNGDRLSFLVTGVGFDAMAVAELDSRRTGPITKASYVAAGLRVLRRYTPPSLEVELDGGWLPGRFAQVLVSNVVHYGGFRVLSSDRRLDDGLFEVYLFPKGSRASLAGYAVRAMLWGLPRGTCTMLRARRVRIVSEEPVSCQVDGDAFGETPVEIAVHPVQSRMVVP
jgi:YegS/Rv2252/BmrU family lipid kinase